MSEVIDIDAYLKFAAVTMMVGQWDSFPGNSNNYYVYRDPISEKFFFIPWGPDDTLDATYELQDGLLLDAMGSSLLSYRLFKDLP
mgnify:FL=1